MRIETAIGLVSKHEKWVASLRGQPRLTEREYHNLENITVGCLQCWSRRYDDWLNRRDRRAVIYNRRKTFSPMTGREVPVACTAEGSRALLDLLRLTKADLEASRPYKSHVDSILPPSAMRPKKSPASKAVHWILKNLKSSSERVRDLGVAKPLIRSKPVQKPLVFKGQMTAVLEPVG